MVEAFGVWPPPIFPSHSWFAISLRLGSVASPWIWILELAKRLKS